MTNTNHSFDEAHVLHELRHYLPSQEPIKDFIHHNSLHAYQHLKFFDAIFKASNIFGFQISLQLTEFRKLHGNGRIREDILDKIIIEKKGKENLALWKSNLLSKPYNECRTPLIGQLRANWKNHYHIDLDNLVQPLLFRILCSYLDQGIALWEFPATGNGFLDSIRHLEKNSLTSFFKTKSARNLFFDGPNEIRDLLKMIVGNEKYFEQYLFDQQFTHHGWSGMVAAIENNPSCLIDPKKITLAELITFELLLEIDALDYTLGKKWKPLSTHITTPPVNLFDEFKKNELNEVIILWQLAFEWSYYDDVCAAILQDKKAIHQTPPTKSFQAIFCIDERECSIRRHVESCDSNCETLGSPGFFGAEFYFQPENGKSYYKLCPQPVTPTFLIKESQITEVRKNEILYSKFAHKFIIGYLFTIGLGIWAGVRLFLTLFRPKMSPAISDAFELVGKDSVLTIENKSTEDRENNLQIGFTVDEMAARVEGFLKGNGLVNNFAPLIYVVAHGSSSANNPHHGAHDCGACSGRPGAVNARVFAFMANHLKVREKLAAKGINIPAATQFVGSLHDTAADQIGFYDLKILSEENRTKHETNKNVFENALDLNAKERSRRFASINTKMNIKNIRRAIKDRSVSLFEPRPELGHGTNTLCIVGSRNITKNIFLDRRAFLNSYDYKIDPEGTILQGVMRPLGPVCGGINLEYYFSRVDNYKFGAGTKLPHHVMGLIGVSNSVDGDLRPGLPLQMIEVHDPVRLLIVVEHFPDVVLKKVKEVPAMYEWYINEWIHLMVLQPETNQFYYFKEGEFVPFTPITSKVDKMKDINSFIESAIEMETNNIVHATKEHLPVTILN